MRKTELQALKSELFSKNNIILSLEADKAALQRELETLGSLRYGDYGLRTTAGRALSFVRSTGLSRVNIAR